MTNAPDPGDTLVTCTATDDSGNVDTETFTVTVFDTTPPELTVPGDISVEGNTTGGANVTVPAATATGQRRPQPDRRV